ncbi:hypothetical protein M9434_005340 [Picochlorum sp. BPE23]|nr:hypothetical protein M9434_005340 [Picochlorum sp. BPE23]
MVDSQRQQHVTAPTAAERALGKLRNESKNNADKHKILLDCSRKRGRPEKKRSDAEALQSRLAQEFLHFEVENSPYSNLNVQDPLQDALAAIDENIDEARVSQKKHYIKWTMNDKEVILEKLQDFKGKATKNPVAATVKYFAKLRGSINKYIS